MASVSDEEVQQLRDDNEKLREAIANRTAQLHREALEAENERVARALLAEHDRLVRELNYMSEQSVQPVVAPPADLVAPVPTATVDPQTPPLPTVPVVESNQTVEALVSKDPWAQPPVVADEHNGQ